MVKQEEAGGSAGGGVMIVSTPSHPGQPPVPTQPPQQQGGGGGASAAGQAPKDDVDIVEECEIFDTRSEFLDFCKVRRHKRTHCLWVDPFQSRLMLL